MPAVDHRPPRPPAPEPGLRRKKTPPPVNCPIFSYNSDILGPSAGSGVALPASNTPGAPSSRAFFQAWIWLECTPNRLDSSATVASPFRAARATFALNSAVCRLRVCFMSCSLCSATYRSGTLSSPSVRKTGATSVFGSGEWRHEKHGGKPRRSWRKLHLAVDPDSGEILSSELTTTEEGDASLVGPMLDQIDSPIASVTADGAYNGEPIYRSVADHTPDAAVIIPPRSTAVPSDTAETAPTQRDRHIAMIEERGRLGWQRGGRLRPPLPRGSRDAAL